MADDVFKLLSRSTKLAKAAKPDKQQVHPSSGDPQPKGLENAAHEVAPGIAPGNQGTNGLRVQSRKRKRGDGSSTAFQTLPAELDLFGTPATKPTEVNVEARQHGNATIDSTKKVSNAKSLDDGAESLGEDESRRTLREHKVKVTIFEDWETEKPDPSKHTRRKKGKRQSSSDEIIAKTKKRRVELFPKPLLTFDGLRSRYQVSRRLLENVQDQGYTVPTEVQLAGIPLLLDAPPEIRPDLLSIAPTGSGKTLAFLIPVMDAIMRIRSKSKDAKDVVVPPEEEHAESGPLAIVIAPTKELAHQIANEGRKLARGTGIKFALFKKGMEIVNRSAEPRSLVENLAEGDSLMSEHLDLDTDEVQAETGRIGQPVKAHIVVTTPLVLLHAIRRSDDSISPLPTVQYLVLDEADVLLDPLFRSQVLSIWNACSHLDLRVSLWSATIGSNIEALARETIASRHTSLSLASATSQRNPLLRLIVGLKDSALPTVLHKLVFAATEAGKLMALRQLLHPTAPSAKTGKDSLLGNSDISSLQPPFLVFTQTIPRAVALAAELKYDIPPSAGGHTRVAALHADLSDAARDAVMTGFRKGEIWVLITTDLLARGVDFRGVNGVVNYDVPTSAAAYVHRAGRTGRAGREGGVAVTLYAEEDVPFLKPIANVIAASGKAEEKGEEGVSQHWLLNSLPTPTKREKKMLKQRGVESRRPGMEKARISTKSGFDRKLERRKKDAKEAARRRSQNPGLDERSGSESAFEGLGD